MRQPEARAWPLGQGLAGLLLVVAATVLPWATYQIGTSGVSVSLGAGSQTGPLIVAGVVAIALAAARARSGATWAVVASTVVGTLATLASAGVALTRIAQANEAIGYPGGSSAYAIGSGVGILAGLTIVLMSTAGYGRNLQSTPAAIPAGWYPDPHGAATWRWWNGSVWTELVG